MKVFLFLVIVVILIIAEQLYFRIAKHYNIIDKPNERSSHTKVVLRGGGIIFLIGTWLYAIFFGGWQWPFLVGLTLVSVVSFVDDVHSLSNRIRLFVHFSAIILLCMGWGVLNWNCWWIIIISLILCVGIINAYNFMDGINGITGGYTLAVLLPLAILNIKLQFTDQNLIYVILLTDLVFCFYNFRPKGRAKCFAGDVGSVGAAFIVVYLLGKVILQTGDFTYIVFLVVYGTDTILTIIHRIMLHDNIGEAHRKHAYQLMANELHISHTQVSLLYTILQLILSFVMFIIPQTLWWHWGYLIGVSLTLAISYILFMKKYYHLHEEYLSMLNK